MFRFRGVGVGRRCVVCGAAFRVPEWTVRNGNGNYCGRSCAQEARRVPPETRFWEKAALGDPGDCWDWQGSKNPQGYGYFRLEAGRNVRAHCMAFFLAQGHWPAARRVVMHLCDNPSCVNPAHLGEGSYAENEWDAIDKGRMTFDWARGEHHPKTHMTSESVRELRELRAQGWTLPRLAERFGITRYSAHDIARRRTWKHVA